MDNLMYSLGLVQLKKSKKFLTQKLTFPEDFLWTAMKRVHL